MHAPRGVPFFDRSLSHSLRVFASTVSRTENRFGNEKVANTGGRWTVLRQPLLYVLSTDLYRLQIAAREASAQAVPLAAGSTF